MYETFRPRTNFIWAGVAFALILLFAVNSFLVVESLPQFIIEVIFCVLLSGITYALWVRPKLVLKEETFDVVNPLRTESIPYVDVLALETKWALMVVHKKGNTRVWVAPTSGKRGWIADKTFGWYGSNVPFSESKERGSETMSASLGSFSGQAAYLIRERIRRLH